MAYTDHSTSIDHWTFRPTCFLDPWFKDALSRDTEILTRALQQSLSSSVAVAAPTHSDSNNNTNNSSSDTTYLTPTPGLTPPVCFGFDSFEIEATSQGVDAPATKQRKRNGGAPGVSSGKVAKRKTRSTKRSQTTFIAADAGNFRQMVQQVTGSRLGYSPTINIGQILRSEPHRPGNRFPGSKNGSLVGGSGLTGITGCLPTLDTSALLLDYCRNIQHHKQQGSVDPVSSPPPPVSLAEEFDPFVRFPTLDSWNSI